MIPKANDTVWNGNIRHSHDKKVRMSKSQMKKMLIASFDIKGSLSNSLYKAKQSGQVISGDIEVVT
jgi:hypothetical protein